MKLPKRAPAFINFLIFFIYLTWNKIKFYIYIKLTCSFWNLLTVVMFGCGMLIIVFYVEEKYMK